MILAEDDILVPQLQTLIESTPDHLRLQMIQSAKLDYQSIVATHMLRIRRFCRLNNRLWVIYPCIASICPLFSHGVLGPCYSRGGVSLLIAPTDSIILERIGCRSGTATPYPATRSVGQ